MITLNTQLDVRLSHYSSIVYDINNRYIRDTGCRLYSSAVFNDDFVDFAVPEIMRRPVDDLILQMKVRICEMRGW